MPTKKKDAAKKPAGKGPSAPTAAPARKANKIWKTYSHKGKAESYDGFLITAGGDIDKLIAVVPISENQPEAKALRLAGRIADNPALDSPCAINLQSYGKLDSEREIPSWVYAMTCVPFGRHLGAKHPRPFCPVRFARMQQQAAEMAAKDDGRDTSKGQDVAYWDLQQDFDEIADRVKANGPPSLASAADGARGVQTESNPMAFVEVWQMREVVQEFWRLPEPERMRIFNGWRWRSAEARESRESVERTCLTNPLLSVLTLATGNADRGIGARFEEIATGDMHAVRIHVRVGTTQAEATRAIERFHEAVCSDWDKLITDPRGVTPPPRKPSENRLPSPGSVGIDGPAIDHFFSMFEGVAERLGLPMASFEDALLMPDLTVREVYQIDNDSGGVCLILGEERKPNDAADGGDVSEGEPKGGRHGEAK